jgi:cyclic beta-1,2-glucan synthetase
VRDLDNGNRWTPTALPIRHNSASYVVRHGRGYSRFDVMAQGIKLEMLQYVPLSDSIKISRLTIRNASDGPRRLSAPAFTEWVLGLLRGASAPIVITERDSATGAIFARNPWNIHHGGRVAFADPRGRQTTWTADRTEFIGRNCTIDNPAALSATIPCRSAPAPVSIHARRCRRRSNSGLRPRQRSSSFLVRLGTPAKRRP